MSGIYPKAYAPTTEMTEEMANQRAKRWEARYDEALDMAARWQQQYVDMRKERDAALNLLEEVREEMRQEFDSRLVYVPKHRADGPALTGHPDTMIGGGGARRRPKEKNDE